MKHLCFLFWVITFFHAPIQAQQVDLSIALWVRTIFGGLPPVRVDNATVSGIEMGSKLTVKGTPTAWNPNLYYYTLSGGDFRVQVSNLGSSVLRSVDVLTGFKGGDCGLHPAYRKRYRHINILSGDSEWLHFGDLNAIGLQKDMEQVCFWVSSPNEKPDWVEAADTTFCYGVPVNATEATTNQLDVFPSLATESVWVSGAPEGYDTWRLFNVQGHLASTGKYGVAPTPFMVAVDELPPGVYLLWIGNHKKKIVVVH